jgi:predicted GH43/DUF377 family glycosyl hydrolase
MNTRTQAIRQKWIKKGLIYKPSGEHWWNQAYATEPTVDVVNDEVWRIYFGTRDEKNRNRICFIEVDARNPSRIVRDICEPVLPLGKIGTFDDCGMMPSWIIDFGGKKYLYYTAWNVRNTIPYHLSIGLAISEDGGATFQKFSEGPLFSACSTEPYFSGTACVHIEDQGKWRCWYTSCTGWKEFPEAPPEPRYHIKVAESENGIDWHRAGTVAIDYKTLNEGAVGRPSVLREDGILKMWYCYRGGTDYRTNRQTSYRIGYAESEDGIKWVRMDDRVGVDVSPEGWDSEMIEYPHVFEHGGRKYMFYCGNKFGASGFGYAVLE